MSDFLPYFWFLALTLVWAIYLTQEAFISGASILGFFFAKDDKIYRRLNSIIGLHWDGIQVWLILAVGGLFASFPLIYATTLSTMYVPFFLLMYAIIVRGISIELMYKATEAKHRQWFKLALTISSFLIVLVIGVYLMNLFLGINFSNDSFFDFLAIFRPFAIIGGVSFVVYSLIMGYCYVTLASQDNFIGHMFGKLKFLGFIYAFLVICVILYFNNASDVFSRSYIYDYPALLLLPLASMIFALVSALLFFKEKIKLTFITMILSNIFFIFTGFVSMMPYTLVINKDGILDPATSILITDGAAGTNTLYVMFIALLIFLPIVLIYQGYKYVRFWGKL